MHLPRERNACAQPFRWPLSRCVPGARLSKLMLAASRSPDASTRTAAMTCGHRSGCRLRVALSASRRCGGAYDAAAVVRRHGAQGRG